MLIHNIDPVAFNFFIFEIRWYSLAYIFGILLGWYYAKKIISKLKSNNSNFRTLNSKDFDDLIPYLILGIILGGRLGYVFIYNFEYYTENLINILFIWEGGMSFHGGLVGIIFFTFIFSKKKNINTFYFLDIIAIVTPIGLFFGRIANFINAELYGKPTDVPWSIVFSNIDNLPRHPSQIYEAFLEGIILFLLLNFFAFKKKIIFKHGLISGLFLTFYSLLRFLSEIFREPDVQMGYLYLGTTMGQVLSLIMLFFGLMLILILIDKKNEL